MAMLTSNHTGSIHKIPTHTHTHTRTRTRRLLHDQSAGMRNNGTPASTSTSTSSSSSSSTSIQQSAKEIEALFQLDTSISIKLAKELSPSARNELSQARKNLIQSESSISKGAGAITEAEPSKRDLRIHALTQGIPFIGFGIMDNAILIWAGDQIDTHLGVVFGISTLCAAAIGNIISDVAGVGLGAYIEDFCARRLSLPRINLSNAQRNLRSVRWAGQRGICVGLTIGCIIGMFPLLFIDTEEVQMHKKNNKIFGIFRDVMMEAKGLVSAESTCLFLIVADENSTIPAHYNRKQEKSIYIKRFLFCRGYFDDTDTGTKDLRMPVGRGLVSKATIEGSILNVKDVEGHPAYDPEVSVIQHLHKALGRKINYMICVPVLDVYGNTIAVIQATNKMEGSSTEGFSQSDEQILQALATHISVSLQNMHSETETSVKEVVQILKNGTHPF